MSILIKGMEMPKKKNGAVLIIYPDGRCAFEDGKEYKAFPVPPHGRLIDADKLHEATYHRAFETDNDTMWQSGCWVRYRAIEQVQDNQPTVIPADKDGET